MILDIIAFLSLSVLAYAWLAYPILLRVLSAGRKRPCFVPTDVLPDVVVIFSAHNEEAHIRERLRNIQELDYPSDRIRVLVGVDGGTDRTAEIAREMAARDSHIRVVAFLENRGKVAVLKDLVSSVTGHLSLAGSQIRDPPPAASGADRPATLLVFTDANTMFRRDALRKLVAPFADGDVGGVCGRLVFADRPGPSGASAERGIPDAKPAVPTESVYWTWESAMKEMESCLDSCLGANGGIYAIRPGLFWQDVPSNTVIDDFVLGMKVREQGRRMIYAHDAVAEEEPPASLADEWRRRVRIGAGDFQALGLCRRCLLPRFGWFAWAFWSHKVLRWFTPHIGIAAACCVLWLGGRAANGIGSGAQAAGPPGLFWLVCLGGMTAFVLCAVAGALMRNRNHRTSGVFRWCHYFVAINAAILAGFFRFCRGNLSGRWERTARVAERIEPPMNADESR
jgi:cellulose synthase/poly-beta-1,6-N-acetylglucosamine synthase-like glycosyltransferase